MIHFFKYLAQVKTSNGNLCGLSVFRHRTIFREWEKQLRSQKSPLEMELPWISIIAKNYLEQYLSKKNKKQVRVFEYGSGGSSLFFLKYAAEVFSAEHDEAWYNNVCREVERHKISGWQGFLHLPQLNDEAVNRNLDPSEPGDYYTNATEFLRYNFKKYVCSIDPFDDHSFDVVLIDGRSRASCLKHSIPKVKKGGLLVLDNAERAYYNHGKILSDQVFRLVSGCSGALICTKQFTQTNIYVRL